MMFLTKSKPCNLSSGGGWLPWGEWLIVLLLIARLTLEAEWGTVDLLGEDRATLQTFNTHSLCVHINAQFPCAAPVCVGLHCSISETTLKACITVLNVLHRAIYLSVCVRENVGRRCHDMPAWLLIVCLSGYDYDCWICIMYMYVSSQWSIAVGNDIDPLCQSLAFLTASERLTHSRKADFTR